ncbi:MAG TPA: hypothetical protein VG389_19235 [Myxococcota bacterium]|jgi:NifU-like protein involved in Fe-S cluster formation|nr:hypothetical protein [Myxococcota bacterium]
MPARDLMPPDEQSRILQHHARNPQQKGLLPGVRFIGVRDLEGVSHLDVQAVVEGERFGEVRWDGDGTKVFVASASILCTWLKGRSFQDHDKLMELWEKMLDETEVVDHAAFLGDVRALEYVIRLRKDRVREIELPWRALARLLSGVKGLRPYHATKPAAA